MNNNIFKILGIALALAIVAALFVTFLTWRKQNATNEEMKTQIAELKTTENETLAMAIEAVALLDSLHRQSRMMAAEMAAANLKQETIYTTYKATAEQQKRRIEEIRQALTAKNEKLRAKANKYKKAK